MSSFQFKEKPSDLNNIKLFRGQIALVSLNESFAEDIYKAFNEKIARHMTPSPAKDINETKAFIDHSIKGMKAENELVLAIIRQKNSSNNSTFEFLGCCGLHVRGNPKTPEFGIWLKESAHGNKYGLAAITELQQWALKNIHLDFFIYCVDKINIASRKIPEALGGKIYREAKVPTHSGEILDEVIYKIPV